MKRILTILTLGLVLLVAGASTGLANNCHEHQDEQSVSVPDQEREATVDPDVKEQQEENVTPAPAIYYPEVKNDPSAVTPVHYTGYGHCAEILVWGPYGWYYAWNCH